MKDFVSLKDSKVVLFHLRSVSFLSCVSFFKEPCTIESFELFSLDGRVATVLDSIVTGRYAFSLSFSCDDIFVALLESILESLF